MKKTTSCLLFGCLLSAIAVFGQNNPSKEQKWRDEVKEKLRLANQPMDFYGQVLDQANQPVKGLKIAIKAFSLIDPTGKSEDWDQDEKEYELTSGADGRFEFRGKKGAGIEVELQRKEGYLYSINTRKSFDYDPTDDPTGRYPLHKPDAQRPVVFRVWKAQGGETVVKWEAHGSKAIPQDGTFVAVDLLEHEFRAAESLAADFRVALTAEIPPNAKPSYKCRWSVRIEAIDGGLVVTADEYMYLAPESGYQTAVEFVFDPANADWERGRQPIKFYLQSGGGTYCARVTLDIGPRVDLPTGTVLIQSVINLTGSRNLEEGRVLPYLPRDRVDFARSLYP